MIVNWVCPKCSSNNNCEESEHMACMICGYVYEKVAKKSISRGMAGSVEKVGKKMGVKKETVSYGSGSTKVTSGKRIKRWSIKRSDRSSKEAYVTATPIYDDTPAYDAYEKKTEKTYDGGMKKTTPPMKEKSTSGMATGEKKKDKSPEKKVEERKTVPSTKAAFCEPWPGQKIRFDKLKMEAAGVIGVERVESGGSKAYKVIMKNGSERVLNETNITLVGFAKKF